MTLVIDGVLSHKTWKFKHLKFLTVFLAKDFSLCTRDEGRRRSITTMLYVLLYYDSQPLLSFSAPAKILTQFAPELRSTQTPVADRYSVSVGLLKSHHPAFGKQITKVFGRLLLWILTCVFQIRQNWGQCFLWQALPNVGQEVSNFKISKFYLLWEKKFDEKIYLLGWLLLASGKDQNSNTAIPHLTWFLWQEKNHVIQVLKMFL